MSSNLPHGVELGLWQRAGFAASALALGGLVAGCTASTSTHNAHVSEIAPSEPARVSQSAVVVGPTAGPRSRSVNTEKLLGTSYPDCSAATVPTALPEFENSYQQHLRDYKGMDQAALQGTMVSDLDRVAQKLGALSGKSNAPLFGRIFLQKNGFYRVLLDKDSQDAQVAFVFDHGNESKPGCNAVSFDMLLDETRSTSSSANYLLHLHGDVSVDVRVAGGGQAIAPKPGEKLTAESAATLAAIADAQWAS